MTILNFDSPTEVLLVQPEYGEEVKKRIFQPGMEFPYNLTCLSSFLEKEGISNEIFDLRIHKRANTLLTEVLRKLKPRVVGITSVTSGINNAAKIAKAIKDVDKNIITVIGGCHASALPDETLINYLHFDYLVHGEGEIVFTNLINAARISNKEIENLKGIAFRKDGRIQVNPREKRISNLDELPFPARHKVDIHKYVPNPATRNYWRLPTTGLSVGRGCPYKCLFCYKGVWGNSVYFRSCDHVLLEIKNCIERFGTHDFRFYDDVLTFPRWDIKGFSRKIIESGIDIKWSCWSRVNDVNYETLALMKKAGCYHIKYGIEFGTEKALKLSKKGITLEQSRKAIKITKEIGIECKGSFIFGIPGETMRDCRKTLEFALDLSPDFATFYAYDCIPGSKFYEQVRNGSVNNRMLPREATERLVVDAYKKFYLRYNFVLQRIKNLFKKPCRETWATLSGIKMILIFFVRKVFTK
jgi:radical SAM superfamily enzyme YgiQ (UPF0313 family)